MLDNGLPMSQSLEDFWVSEGVGIIYSFLLRTAFFWPTKYDQPWLTGTYRSPFQLDGQAHRWHFNSPHGARLAYIFAPSQMQFGAESNAEQNDCCGFSGSPFHLQWQRIHKLFWIAIEFAANKNDRPASPSRAPNRKGHPFLMRERRLILSK
jgi:hypothetical protein